MVGITRYERFQHSNFLRKDEITVTGGWSVSMMELALCEILVLDLC